MRLPSRRLGARPSGLRAPFYLAASTLVIVLVGLASQPVQAAASSTFRYYHDPLRDTRYRVGRIDQGVDFTFKGNREPIYAIGEGRIEGSAEGPQVGWPGHVFIRYKLTDGDAKGVYIYVAEDCRPHVSLKDGTRVHWNTVLCYAHRGPMGIEMGFAQSPAYGWTAAAYNEYVAGGIDGLPTNFGRLFSHFLGALGGPEGNIHKSTYGGKYVLHSTRIPPIWSPKVKALLNPDPDHS